MSPSELCATRCEALGSAISTSAERYPANVDNNRHIPATMALRQKPVVDM